MKEKVNNYLCAGLEREREREAARLCVFGGGGVGGCTRAHVWMRGRGTDSVRYAMHY